MGTMTLFQSQPQPRIIVVTNAAPTADPVPPAAPAAVPERSLTPAQLEVEAERATVKAESARRFRDAGDRYLNDQDNYAAALRCYRNFLDEADLADLVSAPSDTWLLASLKNARSKETN
jgi:hypothetical protein